MDRKYLTVTDTAKLIRAALKESFPSVKFSVRSKSYSGGSSINIGWTDGPTSAQVDAVADQFEGGYFDGMIDYKGSVYHKLDGEPVHFCADFVFCNQRLSDELIARGIAVVVKEYGGCEPITVAEYRNGGAWAWRSANGSDMGRALNQWLSGKSEASFLSAYEGMTAEKSATVARVAFDGSDEYGQPFGSRGYPNHREVA
jgi:hypothetical protein